MLKTLGIIAVIGAIAPGWRPQVIRGGWARQPSPVPTVVSDDVIDLEPVRFAPLRPERAVRAFLAELQEYGAGGAIQIRWIKHSYDKMAAGRGWPEVSVKALSTMLVGMGCERTQLDLRRFGKGRPTALELPRLREAA